MNDTQHHIAEPGTVVWLTGLPGSGKSTLASALRAALAARSVKAIVLDGDALRAGICADLGFSDPDRAENVRRIAHIAKLFCLERYVVIVASISPLAYHRSQARSIVGTRFIEVFVSAPLEVCVERDPKGMYALARKGRIPDFTGVSAAYEPPTHPDLEIDTSQCSIEEAVAMLLCSLRLPAEREIYGLANGDSSCMATQRALGAASSHHE